MRILYVTTISNTVNAFLVPHIKMLVMQGNCVDIACNVQKPISSELTELGCKVKNIPFQRSPIRIDNLHAYRQLKSIVSEKEYDIVHCHTPVASFETRIACRKLRKNGLKVIYTAHGFHFFKGAPLLNWILYYPAERLCSHMTDAIITINKSDFQFAKKHLKAKQIRYIPGTGVNTEKLYSVVSSRLAKRRELGIPDDAFVILSTGELNDNKNHQVILRALAWTNLHFDYLICGEGYRGDDLDRLAARLGIRNNVKLLGYRQDIAEICMASDVFAFPSKREGLGLAAIEAMSCGLPIVTSDVHGINDYSENGITGFKCPPNDAGAFADAIMKLYSDPVLRKRIGESNIETAKKYDISESVRAMAKIYQEVMTNETGGRKSQRNRSRI